MEKTDEIQHYILTRFNLYLWNKDKGGCPVRTKQWLEHRFKLFERYCLPSIKNQTCQNFEWIVLFDSTTPDAFKERIEEWQKKCPQLVPVYVEPQNGRYFAEIFRREVAMRLNGNRVITTYLDNDDALNVRFVEDLQQRVLSLANGTFIFYTEGYQYFTDHQYLMKIHYPKNHFVSVVESCYPATIKTVFGYGSHYYIDKIKDAKIEYINGNPMWCQVVHEKNMGNDAYFLGARMINDNDKQNENTLAKRFGLQVEMKSGLGLYMFRFLPRYCKTFSRRCGYVIFRNRFK